MKIGILGAGNMGGTLGRLWAELGHDVMFGLRDEASVKAQRMFEAIGAAAQAGTLDDAAAFGEVVLAAVPWEATQEVIESVAGRLAGKVLIDCTNPIKPDLSGLVIG